MTLQKRSCGVLLPLFSLPGTPLIGTLGRVANQFASFLADTGFSWWQMLPITPIDPFHSPYSSCSAFAGETLFLDLEDFVREGLLEQEDLDNSKRHAVSSWEGIPHQVNYARARQIAIPLYQKAYDHYKKGEGGKKYRQREESFREENSDWLDDFVLYRLLSLRFGTENWSRWPEPYRTRDQSALKELRFLVRDALERKKFLQLVFDVQWSEFKDHCHRSGIQLLGDVPIYAAGAETWVHPELFLLNDDGGLARIAGAPADAFNPDGQRWNLPVYNWQKMEENQFDWWVRRIGKTLSRFDAVRLDHFIGFYNYYSFPPLVPGVEPFPGEDLTFGLTPATEIDDQGGFWTMGPGEKLLDTLFDRFDKSRFIAEDLGVMTPGVHQLRDHYELPGMEVLVFSFDGRKGNSPDPMKNWRSRSVACTGTHDTETILGWLKSIRKGAIDSVDFDYILRTLASYIPNASVPKTPVSNEDLTQLVEGAIRGVMQSQSILALFPFQDLLALDDSARMNFPGRSEGNWSWRFVPELREEFLSPPFQEKIRVMIRQSGR